MHIIRSGVDSIYLAIKGTLPTQVLVALQSAKSQAGSERHSILLELADGQLFANVNPHGATGGYAYTWDTGLLGAIWCCREAADQPDWNFFVKPHSSALLAHGFAETIRSILTFIPTLGGTVVAHAVNRIDYAVDIRADDFELKLDDFVTHPRSKRIPHWRGGADSAPSAVFAGRRVESVTIGKMPGRQVSIYDKTAEVRSKGNGFWFDAWRIARANRSATVWRTELRFGKRELKERRAITTIADLEQALRPAMIDLLASIRYLAPGQSDPNISRRKPHKIWLLVTDHIHRANLLGDFGELAPARLIEMSLEQTQEVYRSLLVGNAAGLAAMMDLDDMTIETRFSTIVTKAIHTAVGTDRFQRALSRARARRRAMGASLPASTPSHLSP